VRWEDIEQIKAPLTLLLVHCEFAVQLLAVSKIPTSVERLDGVLPARLARWFAGTMHVCIGLITKEVEEILVDDCANECGNELSDLTRARLDRCGARWSSSCFLRTRNLRR
jgi:hypothetical protein